MKKVLIVIISIIVLIIAAAAILPSIFKDDIKKEIDKALTENLNANVYFDVDKFNITLFSHFPNPTVELRDFGIVGKDEFAKDTLTAVQNFDITIDLFSLFGDKPTVKSLNLDNAFINIIVLEDGTANYDIAIASEDSVTEEDTTSSNLEIGIDSWTVDNSRVIYDDRSLPYYLELKGVSHSGSGDFTLDVFDMETQSEIESVYTSFDGVTYLSGQHLDADVTLNMDLTNMKFTFKENKILLNDFPLSFDGYLAMPEEDIEMDINFATEGASIKSLYSLVPAAFTEGYESIKAEGSLSFSGYVKGIYNDNSMPGFNVALKAENGLIQYPDLPSALKNINMDMLVDCPDGNIDYTTIDIKKFHLDFGQNPVDMTLLVKNLVNYDMNANVKASLNLEELSTMFPMEGMAMKGIYKIDLTAEGVYDSVKQIIPKIAGNMSMQNGYIKYSELPTALENMNFTSSLACPTGKMEDFKLQVNDFNVKMGEDQFAAQLLFENLVDYAWDLTADGTLNLALINDYYPVEGMSYKGNLVAHLKTKGKYSDVEAERYGQLPTSGSAELTDFVYQSVDMPTDFMISKSRVEFNPERVTIQSFDAKAGSSDFSINGFVSNYLDYALSEDGTLAGQMNLKSNRIDVNEFMTGEETEEETEDTTAMEVIEVPKNIDFVFASNIGNIYYDNLNLKNAKGEIVVRDGKVNMNNLGFGLFNGEIVMNGTYDTSDPDKPAFSYDMSIKKLSIPQSVTAFETVQTFAPFARNINGDFSTDFKVSGLLGQDMMPKMETLVGGGLIKIAEAAVTNSKLVSGINSLTSTQLTSEDFTLKDVAMSAEIKDGRARVKPFDVQVGDHVAKVEGSIGLDQSLDYTIATEFETGSAGAAVSSFISDKLGKDIQASTAKVKFSIGGTATDPKVSLASIDYGQGEVKAAAEEKVEEEVEKAKEEVKQKVEEKTEEVKKEVEEEVQKKTEEVKEETKKEVEEKKEEVKKEAEKKLKDLFGK